MLTRDEKELLEALKEQMDDEQKEAVDAMDEQELKGLLKEARKELERQMGSGHSSNGGGYWKFVGEHGHGSFIGASLAYLFMKKPGCGCLVILLLVVVIGVIVLFNVAKANL